MNTIRLAERTGLNVGVAAFRRYVHATMPELLQASPMPISRPEVGPREEGQVDLAYMGPWQDSVTARTTESTPLCWRRTAAAICLSAWCSAWAP